MNSTQKTLTDYIVNGRPRYADGGVQQNQGGNAKIKICGDCGSKVVFVQSTKTGKWYLADVFQYKNGNHYYSKADPHFKSCQTEQNDKKIFELQEEIKTLDISRLQLVNQIIAEYENNVSREELRVILHEATAEVKAKIASNEAQIEELRAAGARI